MPDNTKCGHGNLRPCKQCNDDVWEIRRLPTGPGNEIDTMWYTVEERERALQSEIARLESENAALRERVAHPIDKGIDELECAERAWDWIRLIAEKERKVSPHVEIRRNSFQQADGGVVSLWVNGTVRAVAVSLRCEMNRTQYLRAEWPLTDGEG